MNLGFILIGGAIILGLGIVLVAIMGRNAHESRSHAMVTDNDIEP